jgi:hypothetical protein
MSDPNNRGLLRPWQPGQSGNPAGRGIGARSKWAEKYFDDLYPRWCEHGAAVLDCAFKAAHEDPHMAIGLLRTLQAVLPRQLHVRSENTFAGMSDEELADVLAEIKRQRVARAGTSDGAGSSAPVSGDKLN